MSVDVKGKGRADRSRPLNPKATAAAEIVKRDTELRAQFVVVPPGNEAKPISCPICKETLKSEFLEEDEDCVWKNAVVKDDRVSSSFLLTSSYIFLLDLIIGLSCYLSRGGRRIRQQSRRSIAN